MPAPVGPSHVGTPPGWGTQCWFAPQIAAGLSGSQEPVDVVVVVVVVVVVEDVVVDVLVDVLVDVEVEVVVDVLVEVVVDVVVGVPVDVPVVVVVVVPPSPSSSSKPTLELPLAQP